MHSHRAVVEIFQDIQMHLVEFACLAFAFGTLVLV